MYAFSIVDTLKSQKGRTFGRKIKGEKCKYRFGIERLVRDRVLGALRNHIMHCKCESYGVWRWNQSAIKRDTWSSGC